MQMLFSLAIFLITIIFSIMGYLIKSKIERLDNDVYGIKSDMKEFKDNYLDRFEKLNNNINNSKIQILEKFHELELHLKNKKL
jgi:uncharacterized protein YkvS